MPIRSPSKFLTKSYSPYLLVSCEARDVRSKFVDCYQGHRMEVPCNGTQGKCTCDDDNDDNNNNNNNDNNTHHHHYYNHYYHHHHHHYHHYSMV